MLPQPTSESLSPRERSLILFVTAFGGFLVTFMSSGINVGLKYIAEDFPVSAVYLNWISLSMVLVAAAFLLPFGRLADVYGRMRFFVAGTALYSIASFASALAPSAEVLLALRMLTGISLAIGSVTGPALVILAYPLESRGRALGWTVAGVYLGVTLGPVLGGFMFAGPGWRAFFYILAGVNLINVIILLGWLRHLEWKEPKQGRFDVAGALLYGIGLVILLLGFSWLPSVRGALFFAAGLAGLAGFLWWESRASDPLLPVDLLRRNRVFAFGNSAVLVNYAATAAMSLLLSYYLEYNRGLSGRTAGLVLAAGSLVQAISSPVAGRLADRVTARYVASSGMGLCVIGLFCLIFLGQSTPYWYIIMALCLMGLGFAFFSTPMTYAIMGSVDRSRVGVASATISAVRAAGMNLSLGVATMLIALLVGAQKFGPQNFPQLLTAIRVSFIIFTALCVLGIGASLVGPGKREARRGA